MSIFMPCVLGLDVPGGREGAWALAREHGYIERWGALHWPMKKSEAYFLRELHGRIEWAQMLVGWTTSLWIAVERPFLYRIAPVVGAVKMSSAILGIPCYTLGTAQARKALFGTAKPLTPRVPGAKHDRVQYKREVREELTRRKLTPRRAGASEHMFDAALYALAAQRILSTEDT